MARRTTRTRSADRRDDADAPELPDADRLAELKLSPEVAWYLISRGIPLPDCAPQHKTPEPRDEPGARFDPDRVDRVLRVFHELRHTQGQWAGAPLDPDPWQVGYVLAPVFGWVWWDDDARDYVRIINSLYVDVPRKNGKGVYTGEMILTRDGWKRFGDLRVGDEVHAEDGTLTRVRWTSPIRELDCYRVTFGDGQSVVCDADHRWTVWDRYGHDPQTWAETRTKGAWRVVEAPELHQTHRSGARGDARYSVRTDRVLDRPVVDLPLDPYLLGAWLGDGATDAARITSADPTIPEAFTDAGFTVRRIPGTITYAVNDGLRPLLRALGVLGRKHVPDAYLIGSADQRLALLQGLMDTDGTVIRGPNTPRVEFTTTNHDLADAVLFLARSLGWRATSKEGRATFDGQDHGPKWRVSWTAFADRAPFRLDRKRNRLHQATERRTRSSTNTIVRVERAPTVPTMCISVEHSSEQFLIGPGLIPTHNSTLCGGIAVYLLAADGEPGAQVVAAATTRDQAGYVFKPVKLLAEKSPALKKHVRALARTILHPRSGSSFEVVSSVAEAQHGANLHGAVIDELHVHKDPELVETIETGTGSRRQPLISIITTADSGRQGTIYARKRERIEQLARGALKDPSTYGVVWGAEKTDDPFAEETWRKANPGYGISPTRNYLRRAAAEAKQSPAALASFLRLHLGIRTKQETRYFDLAEWDENAGMVREDQLVGRRCFGGLDLSSTTDLTALCWLFPREGHGLDALWRFWLPEARLEAMDKATAGLATAWKQQGWLSITPGNVVDYDFVRAQIVEDAERFTVVDVGYDPWNAPQIVIKLGEDGLELTTVRQGYASLSPPTKEALRLVKRGTVGEPMFCHGGNPVMRWMTDNFAVAMDPAGNVKPDKARAAEKIDGWSAAITALSRLLAEPAEAELQIF